MYQPPVSNQSRTRHVAMRSRIHLDFSNVTDVTRRRLHYSNCQPGEGPVRDVMIREMRCTDGSGYIKLSQPGNWKDSDRSSILRGEGPSRRHVLQVKGTFFPLAARSARWPTQFLFVVVHSDALSDRFITCSVLYACSYLFTFDASCRQL